MPIDGAGWLTGGRVMTLPPPPPKPEQVRADQQTANPRRVVPDSPSSPSRPLEYFTGPLTPAQEQLRSGSAPSLLPADASEETEPQAHPTAGLAADDPRAVVIDQGYQVQQIDQQVNALADQPLDIEGAEGRVQAAQAAQQQFWANALTPQQERELKPIEDAATAAPNDAAIQDNFNRTLQGMLKPEQQQQQRTLQRASEDAVLDLEGQQLGQRLAKAQQAGAPEQLSLVMADARVFVSGVRQLDTTRKTQDALTLVMTPENRQKLAVPEQRLRDAVLAAQSKPEDADAQQRLEDAESGFDSALAGVVSSSDKRALDALDAASKRERDLNASLMQEAETEHSHYEMNQKDFAGLNATERRVLELTNTDYGLLQQQREIRELAVQAANSTDETRTQELLQKLDDSIVDIMRKRSDAGVHRAEFNRDIVAENQDPATQPTMKVSQEFAVGLPPEGMTVEAANRQLDAAKDQRAKLEEALKPPPEAPRSFWDSALDIGVGVLEVAVGAALTFGSGGLLAGAGVLIMADGALRTTHSIVDASKGEVTDTYQSQAMQNLFGWDRGAANRVDTVLSLAAMAPGLGVGALKLLANAGKLAKVAGGFGAVTTLDMAQAQLRYAAFNDTATPFAVQGLTSLGLSSTAANYVMFAGGMVSAGGLMSASLRSRPGVIEPAFKQFTDSNAAQSARVADWYSRNAPEDVRRSVAAEFLGHNASAREVARQADKLSNKSLVVIRDGDGSATGGDVIAGAVLKSNSRGRFGFDPLGGKVGKHTTQIRDVFGDDLGVQQAIAASVVGVEKFTHQNAISWSATDPQDSRLAPGAVVSDQRVRRGAVNEFNRMSEAERPEAVNAALATSTSTKDQLKALADISTNDRYAWPARTQDIVYKKAFSRAPELFGNETLGKVVHMMDKKSYVNQFNAWANPAKRVIEFWEKSHPRVREIETFPAEGGRPAMVATLNKSNTLDEAKLYEIASASIESRRPGADTDALARIPEGELVNKVMDDLRVKDVITLRDADGNLLAGGALSQRAAQSADPDVTAPAAIARPRGTVHLSDLFTTEAEGWAPLMSATEKAAREQGARHLATDPALADLIELNPQASSPAQALFWNTRDGLSHARESIATKTDAFKDSLKSKGDAFKESLTSIDDPRLSAIVDKGRAAGSRVSGWAHSFNEHANPYSTPHGVEPGAWHSAIQDSVHALRYMTKQALHTSRNAILLSLGPQAAAGEMYMVTNEDLTVLPFNGLRDSPSIALYFSWTGTLVTLWSNDFNIRGPLPLDPNGLPPLLRVRSALNDPNGPKSAGVLATGRLILGGEINLGIRYFGSNHGVSAQSTMSLRLGRVNMNLRADVPVQPGGPKGGSWISSGTPLALSMGHTFYFDRYGVTMREPRVNMIFTLQTSPLSPADQAAAFRAGEHHTRAGKGVSGGAGVYFTLNPAYNVPDFRPG